MGNKNQNLATIVDVKKAYVMKTALDSNQNVFLGNQFDIGLIVPLKSCLAMGRLSHLSLPLRYTFFSKQ